MFACLTGTHDSLPLCDPCVMIVQGLALNDWNGKFGIRQVFSMTLEFIELFSMTILPRLGSLPCGAFKSMVALRETDSDLASGPLKIKDSCQLYKAPFYRRECF